MLSLKQDRKLPDDQREDMVAFFDARGNVIDWLTQRSALSFSTERTKHIKLSSAKRSGSFFFSATNSVHQQTSCYCAIINAMRFQLGAGIDYDDADNTINCNTFQRKDHVNEKVVFSHKSLNGPWRSLTNV